MYMCIATALSNHFNVVQFWIVQLQKIRYLIKFYAVGHVRESDWRNLSILFRP